jgi:acyl-CoA synthetase (NDP forming)
VSKNIEEELTPLFNPKSVALVGISESGANVGYMFLHSLREAGFEKIYPVNPKGGVMLGTKVYTSIKEIPERLDLAVVTVPREAVREIIVECAQNGTRGIVLYSAGFAEIGEKGKKIQEELVKIARQGGTRIIGPNCLGTFNPSANLITQTVLPHESGPVGVISHSGFMFVRLLTSVASAGLGPSKGVSSGSDCDLSCVDFLEYLGQDEETEIIVAYLEGIRDGKRLLQVASKISPKKPIIILKGADTVEGIEAAASHTGTMAVSHNVWKSLCKQAGIISVDGIEEMMDTLLALYHLPKSLGRRVGIISTPGGLAVLSTDACSNLELKVPSLSPNTQKQLADVVETLGTSVNNPVDLGLISALMPGHYFTETIRIVVKDPNIDMLLAAFTGPADDDDARDKNVAELIINEIDSGGKPTVICDATPEGWPKGQLRFLAGSRVPVYPEPKRAAYALNKLVEYSEFLSSIQR